MDKISVILLMFVVVSAIDLIIRGTKIKRNTLYVAKVRYWDWGLAISVITGFFLIYDISHNGFNGEMVAYYGLLIAMLAVYIIFRRCRGIGIAIYNVDEGKIADIFNSILKKHGVRKEQNVFIELDNSSMYVYKIRNFKSLTNPKEIVSDFITLLKTVKDFNIKITGTELIILGIGVLIFVTFMFVKNYSLFTIGL